MKNLLYFFCIFLFFSCSDKTNVPNNQQNDTILEKKKLLINELIESISSPIEVFCYLEDEKNLINYNYTDYEINFDSTKNYTKEQLATLFGIEIAHLQINTSLFPEETKQNIEHLYKITKIGNPEYLYFIDKLKCFYKPFFETNDIELVKNNFDSLLFVSANLLYTNYEEADNQKDLNLIELSLKSYIVEFSYIISNMIKSENVDYIGNLYFMNIIQLNLAEELNLVNFSFLDKRKMNNFFWKVLEKDRPKMDTTVTCTIYYDPPTYCAIIVSKTELKNYQNNITEKDIFKTFYIYKQEYYEVNLFFNNKFAYDKLMETKLIIENLRNNLLQEIETSEN